MSLPTLEPPEVLILAADRARSLLDVMSEDDAYRIVENLWERQEARRLERYRERTSGWRRGQPRCPVCKSFKTVEGEECPQCRYSPGQGFREAA